MIDEEIAPWRPALAHALQSNRYEPHSRYFQLATVRLDGTPANRTVVFRGFLTGTNQLQIITDRRSEKITELAKQSQAEICWYFSKSREQFRLLGTLSIIDAQEIEPTRQKAREKVWREISDNARAQFSWPTPKAPRTAAEDSLFISTLSLEQQTEPSVNFCLGLLQAREVDHLQLKPRPQQRHYYIYSPEQTWLTEAVNP